MKLSFNITVDSYIMNLLKKMDRYIPCENELRQMASIINSWEVETRYNDKFVALLEDIDICLKIADDLIDYCDNLVKVK